MIQKLEKAIAPGATLSAWADPVFRLTTSLIFIIGGLGHFGRADDMLARIEESPWRDVVLQIGDPQLLLWLSGGVFVIAGITLALGWMTRLSAVALFVTLIPITISIHFAPGHTGPLFKNVAILGALFYFYCRGAGAYSLDSKAIAR